jgi:hypothetical protein
LSAFEASFYYLTFVEKTFFSKIQNGGFFEDYVIFEEKSTFLQNGPSHPTQLFSNSQKANL